MACFTTKEAKDLWDYAKEKYLKVPGPHGYMDFKELTKALSDDIFKATGGQIINGQRVGGRFIVPEEIAKLLSTPKTIRSARNNLLMADSNRSGALRQAREFVAGQEQTPLSRFAQTAYQAPYAAKVVGHGPALHVTHAWPYAFDPAAWKNFGATWVNAWKSMKDSNARAVSERIMLNPRFDEKIHSGLAIDPRRIYDDVQQRAGFFGTLGKLTANSFLGLKELRSMQWDALWDTVPDHLKTDDMRNLLSLNINHMTGAPGPEGRAAMSGKFGKGTRAVMFAPSLDIARVMRPVDLVKSIGTEAQSAINKAPIVGEQVRKFWGQSSPEQQWMARQNMKQWTRIAATFSALLYSNHLLLKHFFGSKEDVNVHDPFKVDWLAAKAPDGKVWQSTCGHVPMIRAATRVALSPDQAASAIGNYLMGKLNPAISLALELRKGKGFGGTDIPKPFGTQPATPGNYAEFVTAELGPIATEEGIHEFAKQMKDQTGVDQTWNEKFLRSIYKAGLVTIPSIAGTHLYEPTKPKSKTRTERQPFAQ